MADKRALVEELEHWEGEYPNGLLKVAATRIRELEAERDRWHQRYNDVVHALQMEDDDD